MRILIMDDEEFIREFMVEALQMLGHTVKDASEGDEAVAFYKEAYNSSDPFDVVFLDITVYHGTGGDEAVKKMIEFDPNVKAVALSGHKTGELYTNFRDFGFLKYLLKPVELSEIEAVLSELAP